MKKILAIILALAAAVCCLTVSTSAAGSFSLKVEAGTYTFGTEKLVVEVVVDGSVAVNGIDLNIKCPEGLSLDARSDIVWNGEIASADLENDYVGSRVKNFTDGTVYLLFAAVPLAQEVPPINLSGTIATLTFTVDESKITPDSDLTFSFAKNDISDENGKSLTGGTDFDVNPNPDDGKIELTCETHDFEVKYDTEGHWNECKKCGYKEAKTPHTSGSEYPCVGGKCTGCEYVVPATEHTSVPKHDANQHWKECEVCGTITSAKENHRGGTANCTEKAVCEVCGEEYGGPDSDLHDWQFKEHKEEATCTKEGIDVYVCGRCGKTEERATEKAPHVESEDYKSDSESHWHYCVNCDAVIGDKEAHKGGTANCTEQAKCSVCGTAYGELDKTAHKWNDGVVTKEATCMVDGVKTYTCTLCGDTKTEAIKALGHDYGEGKITTPATCLKDGVKTYTCKRNCRQEGATKTEAVKATGHKPAAGYKSDATNHWQICENENCDAEDHIINVTAHTYTAGEYEHDAKGHWQVCTVCKAETEHEDHVKGDMTQDESGHWYKCTSCDEKLEFDAHTKATLTAAVEPYKDDNGVKHDGSLAYWHCPDCGKYFLDDNGKKTGVFDDTSSFTVKYQDDCDDLGHTLTVISTNALSHTYMCTRECGFFWTEAHIFNEYGFCNKCGYKIPGFEETKPEDNVEVDSPTEGTEQGGDTEGDEMNADDTENTADAPAEAPAESEPAPAPAPAETNPETGLAMSVIPAILAAAALVVKRR